MEFNTLSLSITTIIIIITVGISIAGFANPKLKHDLIFYPPAVTNNNQWYRFITCGFIHADEMHLAFNMITFYIFGTAIEKTFQQQWLFGDNGKLLYIVLYFSALIVCLFPTYIKNRYNEYYMSLGASGAVAAIIFTYIMLAPVADFGFFFIPIPIKAFIFGALYLIISAYLDKRGGSNINHSAHLWGSLYGIIFIIIACFFIAKYPVLEHFIDQIKDWFSSKFGR